MATSFVGRPCPKCGHVRAAEETAPDWQCPKCGVAYAKAARPPATDAPGAAPGVPATAAPAATSIGEPTQSTGAAILAHLSILIGMLIPFASIILPVIIWVMKKETDELAVGAAKEVLNLQITALIWTVGILVIGLTIFPFIVWLSGLIFLGLLVLPIIGAVKVSRGESVLYPFTIHVFR